MLSLASDAFIPLTIFFSELGACSADPGLACGEEGGDGALGFQDTPPAGFGRGAGGPGAAAGLFSNAAIRSRNEPGFGFVGGGWPDIR